MTRPIIPLAVVLGFVLAVSGPASGQSFTSTKVVETGVNYPGVGTFSTFFPPPFSGTRPSISGTVVTFGGNLTSTGAPALARAGVSGVAPIASTSTPIPGGVGNFNQFSPAPIGLSGGIFSFVGNGLPGPGNAGAYSNVGPSASLTPIVNLGMAYPGGGNFANFSPAAVSGSTFVFAGSNAAGSPLQHGVFTRTVSAGQLGNMLPIVTTSTPMPGGVGNFFAFNDPSPSASPYMPNISGSNVVFGGRNQSGSSFGLFITNGFGISAVATNSTPIPNGTGNFVAISPIPAISGNNVAFHAVGANGQEGFYRYSMGGALTRIADRTTIVPGTSSTFSQFLFTDVAISGTNVAFRGLSTTGIDGIYTDMTGSLRKVIATGDTLDGKIVDNVAIGHFSLDGNTIAVLVSFTNGTDGVYTFTPVPEPTGLLALGAAGLLVARLRRRR